jgi:tetratricopeptide (TPR) repeat protein
LAKQDEKQRLRRRLQDHAIYLSTVNEWEEAIEVNQQILELGEDPITYNRLAKAYMERGEVAKAHEIYQNTLRLNPTNTIARRNIARLDSLISRGIEQTDNNRQSRLQVDLRLFITEAGKTMLTNLTEVPRTLPVEALASGEKVELKVDGSRILVHDMDGELVGQLEPKLGQRLTELINGGNCYIAAVVKSDSRQVRILIREIYQHPSQRNRTSFPGKLIDEKMYEYLAMRYEYETDDIIEEEDAPDVSEMLEEETPGSDNEEIRLDTIEADISDEDTNEE